MIDVSDFTVVEKGCTYPGPYGDPTERLVKARFYWKGRKHGAMWYAPTHGDVRRSAHAIAHDTGLLVQYVTITKECPSPGESEWRTAIPEVFAAERQTWKATLPQ